MAQDVAELAIEKLFAFPENEILVPGTLISTVTAFVFENTGSRKICGGGSELQNY